MRGGEPASDDSIRELERRLGFQISQQFRAFVSKNDGARPENNRFDICGYNIGGVNEFVKIAEILETKQFMRELPRTAYPVALSEFGNYVVIDEGRDGSIYFWDHESQDPIVKIADDFNSFLSMLEPYDMDSVKVDPDDILYVSPDTEAFRQLKARMAERN
jgi:hypothetical protein